MKNAPLWLVLLFCSNFCSAQLVQVVHELYGYTSDDHSVYRIYAELEDPTDFVSAVFASGNNDLYLGAQWNGDQIVNSASGTITGSDLNLSFCVFVADACMDSWVTIGWAGIDTGGGVYWDDVTLIGNAEAVVTESTAPSSNAFSNSFGTAPLGENLVLTEGSWSAPNTPGSNAQGLPFGLNNRVLLAQIATPGLSTCPNLEYRLNIRVFDEADGSNVLEYVWLPDAVDAGQSFHFSLAYPYLAADPGCGISTACNYIPNQLCPINAFCIYDDVCGVCGGTGTVAGCTETVACNYNSLADCDDGSCLYYDACLDCGGAGTYFGCTDPTACNFNSLADCDDDSCILPPCFGSLDSDGSGFIDTVDLLFLLTDFGCQEPNTCVADFTNDGNTNVPDLLLFLTAFGAPYP